jgi:Universal stress protein family
MTAVSDKRISLKSILFLTDFSEPSAVALPFAAVIARSYGAKVTALHVVVPAACANATIRPLRHESDGYPLVARIAQCLFCNGENLGSCSTGFGDGREFDEIRNGSHELFSPAKIKMEGDGVGVDRSELSWNVVGNM